jgi:hypothetical protein
MALVRALLGLTPSRVRWWRWCALLCATADAPSLFRVMSWKHDEFRVEDYIRFLSCHLFGPVNHGQNCKGWERSGEKGLMIRDNQTQTFLIITINDNSIGDLPLVITISDTCKNQSKRFDFDNTINLSSLILNLGPWKVWGCILYQRDQRPKGWVTTPGQVLL